MKQRLLFLLVPAVLLVVVVVIDFGAQDNNDQREIGSVMSSQRLHWEWERQRDPATGKIPENIRGLEQEFVAQLPRRGDAQNFYKGNRMATYDWSHRGPWNVGGRTRGLAFDITGEDTILAGGVSGGMWRSSDGGASWILTTDPNETLGVSSLIQDTREGKEHIWYYGTGERFNSASGLNGFARFLGDGIFKSTDNGRTWRSLPSTVSGTPQRLNQEDITWRMGTDPSNTEEDEVYAAIYGAIARSLDGGETWTQVLKSRGLFLNSFTDVIVTDQGVVYATMSSDGSKKGIYRSVNGVDYTEITPDDFPENYGRLVVAAAPSNQNILYFLGETPGRGAVGRNFLGDSSWHSLWKYTYISGDGTGDGGTWENRSENLPQFGGSFGDFHSQGGYDMLVKVKPDDENVVFIGGTNLYRSTDGFSSSENTAWIGGYRDAVLDINENPVIARYGYPKQHPDQHEVVFSPTDPNVLLTGSDGGVHKTVNCLADSIDWISLNNGYLTTQFFTLAIDMGLPGDEMIMGGTQDNGTWRNNRGDEKGSWEYTGSGDGGYGAIVDQGAFMYVSKQRGRVYRVELDESGNVTGSTRIDPEVANPEVYRFINPFVIDPNDSKVMYTPVGRHIWRNRDVKSIPLDNERATPIGWDSLGNSVIPSSVITSLGISDQNPSHRLWYGTASGGVFRIDDVLGNDPVASEVSSPLFPANGYASCVAVDPKDGDHAIVVFSNYNIVSLFETVDGGETWQSISGNLEENPNGTGAGPSCRWVTILHRGKGTVYFVGTSVGLFSATVLSGDETVWEREGVEAIGTAVVDMVTGRESDGFVAVATHGIGDL